MRTLGLLLVALLLFGIIGCNGSTVEDPQINGKEHIGQPEVDSKWVSVSQEGISFSFDASLASTFNLILIHAAEEGSMLNHPAYLLFTLNNTEDLGDSFSNGYLAVFSVDHYRQIDSMAGDMIDTLAEMLKTGSTATSDSELLYLPYVNAGQLFHSNVKIVSFENGEGIRYLTMHVQDVAPILNEGLLYTFQGLTADKQFYVSFSIPVSHPDLVDTWDQYFADLECPEFSDNFQAYIEEDRDLLNSSPDSVFNPSLMLLDQLIESSMIDNPAILLEEAEAVG